MRVCFANFFRVLKAGGHFVVVVGNNRVLSYRVPNHRILADLAVEEGFKIKLMLVDEIKSRGLMTKRNTTADVIPDEWIIVFEKPSNAKNEQNIPGEVLKETRYQCFR